MITIYILEARLAQRLEHRICNAMVIGSIPIAGFFYFFFLFYMIDNVSLKSKKMLYGKGFFTLFPKATTIHYVV